MSSAAFHEERITAVHHWTERLFSFTTTRDPSFRFRNGHFTMIGLRVQGKPLLRAYSVASANHEERLEFFSIKVPDGPLTSRLQHLQPGDTVLVGRKPTGTLLLDYLRPGQRLWLLATGTGLAPFLSLIRDPETYERFEQVFLVHGCRHAAELAYRSLIEHELPQHEFLGEMVTRQLRYLPTVTREEHLPEGVHHGRITTLLSSGELFAALGTPPLDAAADRVMLCGSPQMLRDLKGLLEARGLHEGSTTTAGDFVVERAFADA